MLFTRHHPAVFKTSNLAFMMDNCFSMRETLRQSFTRQQVSDMPQTQQQKILDLFKVGHLNCGSLQEQILRSGNFIKKNTTAADLEAALDVAVCWMEWSTRDPSAVWNSKEVAWNSFAEDNNFEIKSTVFTPCTCGSSRPLKNFFPCKKCGNTTFVACDSYTKLLRAPVIKN